MCKFFCNFAHFLVMQLIETPISWLPWVEAGLMGLMLLICAIQPYTIAQSLQTLSSSVQRRYVLGENNPILVGLRALFIWGSFALAMLMAIAAWRGETEVIGFGRYMKAGGMLAIAMVGKGIVDKWIQYVFRYPITEKTYYQYRGDVWVLMGVVMMLVSIVGMWLGSVWQWLIVGAVLVAYWILIWWKLMQLFGWSIEHIIYVLLYMIHVEVLPVVVAVVGYIRF